MSTQLTGAAGEFFVAAELARRGWAASITPRGVERTDVLAQYVETGYVVALQVKTTTTGTSFTLGEKNESPSEATNEWYALVGYTPETQPTYYLLPRNHVAVLIYLHHRVWLRKSSARGKQHRPTKRRNIHAPNLAGGEGAWDELLKPTCEIPLRLSQFYRDIFSEAEELGIKFPGPVPLTKRLRAAA